MSILRANTITDVAGTGLTDFPYGVNLPATNALPDPDNRVINGAFDFWQRGTSGTANGYVAADRWVNARNAGTVTQSQQLHALGDKFGTNSPRFYLRQTVSGQSAVGDYAITITYIEGVSSYAGETITVLGWARRSSGSGNVVIEGEQYFGLGGEPSATINAINPTTITLTSNWEPFAAVLTVPSVAGKTLGSDGNDLLALNFWTSAGSNFAARTNSLGIQTIGVDLWGIHIKRGTHAASATEFYKAPELGPELARCQRYYETGSYNEVVGVSNASITGTVFTNIPFKVTKRVIPTVTGTNAQGTFSASALTLDSASIGRSTVVANRSNSGTFIADAEL